MKNKHLIIQKDKELLEQISLKLKNEITIDPKKDKQKLTIKFIIYALLLIALYTLILTTNNSVYLTSAYILFGFSALLITFNFAHDLSHNSIFKSKKINNFFYTIILTMMGAHAEAWKERHVHSHHHAPNVKDYDTDLQITSLIRVEPSAEKKWFHRFQHIYAPIAYSTYSLYWFLIKDIIVYVEDFKKVKASYHISLWTQKALYTIYLLVIPIYVSDLPISTIITAFILMHLSFSVFLLFTFFITHHVEKTEYFNTDDQGNIQTSWFNNQLKSSNDFYPYSEFANFIFGGFNNHIAHHLFPHINHMSYPKMNRMIYPILRENGFEPHQTSYFGGVLSHLKHLKNMGK